ncbi:APC family permease [Alloacidobacterium dinghuense]|uniref:APC family permease n=1 Tax=Alloacidobacterium dinghuense TaxID=2763107 RepID=A0A7G8BIR7_9BACT|nr:APC family permease [Alloacidobacterium dinghuense]QNI32437.1 APC family permease [Alloacidobacterium dinghuense]
MKTAQITTAEHRLQRQLRLRDLVLTQILCVVGSSWVGVAAGLGRAQTLTWIAAMLVFYFPMAGSVIALNRELPLEGGLYVWSHKAFGDLIGFLTAWNIWFYGIAVTATILYAIPTELSYLIGPSAAWLPENHLASTAVVTVTIAAITIAALRGLALSKWIHNIGGIAILVVFAALILLPLWAIARHAPIQWVPLAVQLPPATLRSLALFGQMIFGALCGLEYIAILAGESRQPAKSIAQSVWISSPVICAMFILGTASVVAFARPGRIDFIAPIPQTMRIALGSTGIGNLFAIAAIFLLQLRLIGASSYIFTGVTRLPLAAGWDHLVPAWFTRLHPRWRTPSNSILFTAALVFLLVVLANIGVHAQEAFQVLSNASLTHYELAYLAMFAVPLAGAASLRKALPRWLKWTSMIGFCATLFSLLISAYPFVDVVNARLYAAKILGTTICSNLIAICFYKLRRKS